MQSNRGRVPHKPDVDRPKWFNIQQGYGSNNDITHRPKLDQDSRCKQGIVYLHRHVHAMCPRRFETESCLVFWTQCTWRPCVHLCLNACVYPVLDGSVAFELQDVQKDGTSKTLSWCRVASTIQLIPNQRLKPS
jgi:hypothetical protein